MAASKSTDGQRSEKHPDFPQDTSPKVAPTSEPEKEDESLRRKRRAQLQSQKARADGSIPEDNTGEGAETSEPEPVDPETSSTGSGDGQVHFVAELAVVTNHNDLDYDMPDAPPLEYVNVSVPPDNVDEDGDVKMGGCESNSSR